MPPAPSDSPVGRVRGPEGSPRDRNRNRSRNAPRPRRHPQIPQTSRVGPPQVPTAHGRNPERKAETVPRSLNALPGRRSEALEALLVDLGSQIQKGSARAVADAPRFRSTGVAPLDRLLGGGFPIGRLSEICGPAEARSSASVAPSVGRTAVAQSLVAETLSSGALAAWIDLADAFDPDSALEAIRARGDEDVTLDRLLWVRARDEDEALRACERVMRTEGFELVVFDLLRLGGGAVRSGGGAARSGGGLARPGGRATRPKEGAAPKDVTWLRLARLAAGTRTTLVALSDVPSTGSRAELVLEMRPRRVAWSDPPHLLESIETEAVLRRHRSRPAGEKVALRAALAARLPEGC